MANAGADQEKLVGQPVQLNGSSSQDVDDAADVPLGVDSGAEQELGYAAEYEW